MFVLLWIFLHQWSIGHCVTYLIQVETSIAVTSMTTQPKFGSFPLDDSNCFCSYNQSLNILSCSPSLKNASSSLLANDIRQLINVTMYDCIFYKNRFNLPQLATSRIDYLQLYDINRQDYLVFDQTSFSNYQITHLFISYTFAYPMTMLLLSNDTFSSRSLEVSLRSLYIDSCFIFKIDHPFSRLRSLQSLTLIDIDEFSWSDFQSEIRSLPQLTSIYIGEESNLPSRDIANVLSCNDLSSQWILTFYFIQTCSCQYLSLLRTTKRVGTLYQCLNSNQTIDYRADVCQIDGKEYSVSNGTDFLCQRCATFPCPPGTICVEINGSSPSPNCVNLVPDDYDQIRQRIPVTPLTKKFLSRETQSYINLNGNQTLQPAQFNNIAGILIGTSQNQTESSSADAEIFHQTLANMLSQPWSPNIYATPSSSGPAVWQNLFSSLDQVIRSINDSVSKFEFYSQPISTVSLRFPDNQSLQSQLGWKITINNYILSNLSNIETRVQNITSRIVLHLPSNQRFQPSCDVNKKGNNCTNRYSITSIKSSKLFYNTDRIPTYDVISIIAPTNNQSVTFYFDEQLSANETDDLVINQTNSTSDEINPFYDEVDVMVRQGTCMYLNTVNLTWQTDGCQTDRQSSSSQTVTCTCEHLTMFTVFFSLTCSTPSKALFIISWIGCVLSLIGLILTFILFIITWRCSPPDKFHPGISSPRSTSSTKELRRQILLKPRHLSMVKTMLFVLCILLIIMNILIIILTLIKSGRNLACTIFSALLYYFTLTAFIWKFFFALQQTLFLTKIFSMNWSDQTLLIIYLVLTFFLPICPLIVMFVKYPDATFISSTCNFCWLTGEFLLYGLMIPVLSLVCLNYFLYFYAMSYLCGRNRQHLNLRSTKSDRSRQVQNMKIGIFFATVMGLSWILAFLLLIPNSYVQLLGNIFFCIVNTLQGFAFAVMVIFMLERKSFADLCCWRRTTKSTSTSSAMRQVSTRSMTDESDSNRTTPQKPAIYTVTPIKTTIHETHDPDEHIYTAPIF